MSKLDLKHDGTLEHDTTIPTRAEVGTGADTLLTTKAEVNGKQTKPLKTTTPEPVEADLRASTRSAATLTHVTDPLLRPVGKKPVHGPTWHPPTVALLMPHQHRDWDHYVAAHEEGTFFHTIAWRSAVEQTFSHEPLYLTALIDGRMVGVLPLFLVASRLAGRMLVSVPYGVGGGILADDETTAAALFEQARRIADDRNCSTIDFRSRHAVLADLPIIHRYVGFRRRLPDTPGEVLSWLPRKARAAARNAANKHRLTIDFGDQHLLDVWKLYSISMKRLASINYPFAFFARLADYSPSHHWTCIVRWKGRPVAGLMTLLFKDRVMPYFVGTTPDATRCCAANFIYRSIMERGVADGFAVFDFGRSRRDNAGSYNFKRFHGFEPEVLGYQIYVRPGCQAPNLSPSNPRYRAARKLWSCLPLCVTRPLGARLAKHIPG